MLRTTFWISSRGTKWDRHLSMFKLDEMIIWGYLLRHLYQILFPHVISFKKKKKKRFCTWAIMSIKIMHFFSPTCAQSHAHTYYKTHTHTHSTINISVLPHVVLSSWVTHRFCYSGTYCVYILLMSEVCMVLMFLQQTAVGTKTITSSVLDGNNSSNPACEEH